MPPLWLIVDPNPTDLLLDLATVQTHVVEQIAPGQVVYPYLATSLNQSAILQQLEIEQPLVLPCTWHIAPDLLTWMGFAPTFWQLCQFPAHFQTQLQAWGYTTGLGHFWLPIVLTQKGPLYGEVIGVNSASQHYHQPIHLDDRWRQPLYQSAFNILNALQAPPSTYLLQFGWQDHQLQFSQLWPFPIRPTLASVSVQTPNLLTCYWYTRSGQAVTDLQIAGSVAYQHANVTH